jgi:L-threonylcarbamoyladenylate synthase
MSQRASDWADSAVQTLQSGGTLLYPTHTLWGIGGDARREDVVRRIQRLKGRVDAQPFLVLLDSVETVYELTGSLPPAARALIDAYWPGELTLLLQAAPGIPDHLVGPEGLVGVRLATHPVPRTLVQRTGAWLVSTSANVAGSPSPGTLSDVTDSILSGVDTVVDVGPHPTGVQSTIVAVDADNRACVIREGAITSADISSTVAN